MQLWPGALEMSQKVHLVMKDPPHAYHILGIRAEHQVASDSQRPITTAD